MILVVCVCFVNCTKGEVIQGKKHMLPPLLSYSPPAQKTRSDIVLHSAAFLTLYLTPCSFKMNSLSVFKVSLYDFIIVEIILTNEISGG